MSINKFFKVFLTYEWIMKGFPTYLRNHGRWEFSHTFFKKLVYGVSFFN